MEPLPALDVASPSKDRCVRDIPQPLWARARSALSVTPAHKSAHARTHTQAERERERKEEKRGRKWAEETDGESEGEREAETSQDWEDAMRQGIGLQRGPCNRRLTRALPQPCSARATIARSVTFSPSSEKREERNKGRNQQKRDVMHHQE